MTGNNTVKMDCMMCCCGKISGLSDLQGERT